MFLIRFQDNWYRDNPKEIDAMMKYADGRSWIVNFEDALAQLRIVEKNHSPVL